MTIAEFTSTMPAERQAILAALHQVNFTNGAALPPGVLAALITECSAINIANMLEKRKKK